MVAAHGTAPTASPSSTGPRRRDDMILGRYRILDTNDEGGFGTVHTCWDTRLQRRVAIKRMPLSVDGSPSVPASTLEEALAEARTSSLLAHPNIVTVFDFETDGNDSYLVMEYVDGLNLAELLARVEGGTLSFDECAHVLRSVASALDFAHENGVLHLDIKPANIMIDRTGTVKLADFGMATLASAAGYGGARGGTIGYMPPEQIEGGYVDERTDVFSLAVVVYQALVGHCPFQAPTARESLRKIGQGPRPALSQVEPALAGAVEDTLLAALEPDPQDRPASVADLAADIVPFLGDPQEGQASLSYLIEQGTTDTPADQEPDDLPPEPLLARAPWLPGLVVRGATAASCARVAWQLLPGRGEAAVLGTIAVAVAGAAWPPLGSALAIALLVCLLGTQQATLSFPLALLIALAGAVWWCVLGRRDHLASLSLLLSCALPCPPAGALVAGCALTPGRAFCSAAFSWAFGTCMLRGASLGFAAGPLARTLEALALSPSAWLLALGTGLASLVCSLASRSQSVPVRAAGEVACLAVLGIIYLQAAQMENESIGAAVTTTGLAVAVTLTVIMCIVTVLVGPRGQGQEGEVSHEERHGNI